LSPGRFTLIFIWTARTAPPATGSKKPPPPALAKKGRLGVCVAVLDAVEDDFSAVVFMG
jgi:hypothetical protein